MCHGQYHRHLARSFNDVTSASRGTPNQPIRGNQKHRGMFLNIPSWAENCDASISWRSVFGLATKCSRCAHEASWSFVKTSRSHVKNRLNPQRPTGSTQTIRKKRKKKKTKCVSKNKQKNYNLYPQKAHTPNPTRGKSSSNVHVVPNGNDRLYLLIRTFLAY